MRVFYKGIDITEYKDLYIENKIKGLGLENLPVIDLSDKAEGYLKNKLNDIVSSLSKASLIEKIDILIIGKS